MSRFNKPVGRSVGRMLRVFAGVERSQRCLMRIISWDCNECFKNKGFIVIQKQFEAIRAVKIGFGDGS